MELIDQCNKKANEILVLAPSASNQGTVSPERYLLVYIKFEKIKKLYLTLLI